MVSACLCMLTCGFTACNKNADITVYAPDGAPALAIAKMLKEDTNDDGVQYRIVNPQTLNAYLSYNKQSKNAKNCKSKKQNETTNCR